MVFRYLDKNRTTLVPGIDSIEDLRHRVRYTLLKRVLDNTSEEEPSAELLSELMFGDKQQVKKADFFITTDDRLLKKVAGIAKIRAANPTDVVGEIDDYHN